MFNVNNPQKVLIFGNLVLTLGSSGSAFPPQHGHISVGHFLTILEKYSTTGLSDGFG